MRLLSGLVAGGVAVGVVAAGMLDGGPAAARADVVVARPAAVTRSAVTVAAAVRRARVAAPYAELANPVTGATLWSRQRNVPRPMGSIAKVMTAYVVIKAGHLGRVITVPKGVVAYDRKYGASTAGLRPGERLTAGRLLIAMLLPSGCDAAYALAQAYGPGRAVFIGRMNTFARRLGLTRTHFSDFSGLPYPTETSTYSSARDLVRLGRAAMALPVFRAIVRMRSYRLRAGGGHRAHTWATTDLLLRGYPGAIGIKTGNTTAAGFCLLFEAVRDGRPLIGVVLRSSLTRAAPAVADAKSLLNWGFSLPSG
jgi:serine-type D-Ala-D-Ala carboxypeptidase (penicillin-binding protein 5/6)